MAAPPSLQEPWQGPGMCCQEHRHSGNSSGCLNDMRCPIMGSACTQLWGFIAQIPEPILQAWQITITYTAFTAEVGNRFFLHLFHQKMKSLFNIKLYSESLHPRTSSDSNLLFPGTELPVMWSQPGSKGCSPTALLLHANFPKAPFHLLLLKLRTQVCLTACL